jgi:hypothetical protein
MPDYQNGKIYTIRCKSDNTLIYVGSTITTLSRRLAEHKSKSKKYNTRKIYQSINDNWDDWYIELYEVYPCENKEELNKREGEITREIGTLNYQIAGRSYEEWRDDNIDKIKLTQQEYNKNNTEKLKLTKREYYQNNFEKVKLTQQEYNKNNAEKLKLTKREYYEKNFEKLKLAQQEYNKNNADKIKEQTKLYRENNKDNKREQDKIYRQNNKDKLNEQFRERSKQQITCECGCIIRKYGLPNHLKTKRHIEALNPV